MSPQKKRKPILLDLYCGAGGSAEGYKKVGFYVVGVDSGPQSGYRGDEFVRADALKVLRKLLAGKIWNGYKLSDFAAIHASPPCQRHSDLQKRTKKEYPELIKPTRELLIKTGLPYVIENVEGAPLIEPIILCGTMFPKLRVERHRLFESNFKIKQPRHIPRSEHPKVFTYDKRKSHFGKLDQNTSFVQVTGGGNCTIKNARDAMGITWPMKKKEINEAIPPAYAEYIGKQMMKEIRHAT